MPHSTVIEKIWKLLAFVMRKLAKLLYCTSATYKLRTVTRKFLITGSDRGRLLPHANPMDTGADKRRYKDILWHANICVYQVNVLYFFPFKVLTHDGENVTDHLEHGMSKKRNSREIQDLFWLCNSKMPLKLHDAYC